MIADLPASAARELCHARPLAVSCGPLRLGPSAFRGAEGDGLMGRTFETTRRVEFAETDMAGVVHFANYLRWMEEVEHEFFRSLGTSVMRPEGDATIGWPRVHVSCEYFGPLRFEDEFTITLTIMDVSEKSMTYEAVFTLDGRRVARGRAKTVCCRTTADGFTSIRIPDDLRSLLESSGG